jgi:hypothetical protein
MSPLLDHAASPKRGRDVFPEEKAVASAACAPVIAVLRARIV